MLADGVTARFVEKEKFRRTENSLESQTQSRFKRSSPV